MTDQNVADAVARKLLGELRVGAKVVSRRGKPGTVISVRQGSWGWQWARVKFDSTGGHWEYASTELTVIG